jgi:D-xylose transport system permease protein
MQQTKLEHKNRSLAEILVSGFKTNINQYAMFIALIGIWIIFQVLTGGNFITPRNLSNLMGQNIYIAILAMGMVLVMVAGHIDLSVGFLGGAAGALAAMLSHSFHVPVWGIIAAALAFGLVVGLWQGFWIAYRGVPAFIVSLGTYMVMKGLIVIILQSQTLYTPDGFNIFGQGFLPQLFLKGDVGSPGVPFHDLSLLIGVVAIIAYWIFELRNRANRLKYGFEVLPFSLQIGKIILISVLIAAIFAIQTFYVGISYAFLLLIAFGLVFTFVTTKTVFGRHVYALGGNKEAARLSGINIQRRTLTIFVIMGTLAAVAGIIFTGRLASATPAAGTLWELDAIASCVIGGTSTMGGEGTIIGAIIGAFVIGSINNGLGLMNQPIEIQFIVKGLILVLAVWFDITSKKRR